jgi:hypothetical protein
MHPNYLFSIPFPNAIRSYVHFAVRFLRENMDKFPIVYIRGYAMTPTEVEATFNSPFYGFELGSTQYKLGSHARPDMHIFESPLVRLIEQESYVNAFNHFVSARNEPLPNSVPIDIWRQTLWIYRFYDSESKLLGGESRYEVEDYAEKLALFLEAIRAACGNIEDFKVNLVAHSMGGLVARCYLQNGALFDRPSLRPIKELVKVNCLFTYGSPHKGISFRHGLGWVEDLRDLVGFKGSDTFGPDTMRRFLALGENEELHTYRPARQEPKEDRIFCLVGTNYRDYAIWVSKHSVGPASDGLVAIENAYIKGAARAYVHRAHSGPFGLVNSEEGYQNLTRFLFGDVRYELSICPVYVKRDLPYIQSGESLEYLEVNLDVVIRGLPTYINTRRDVDNSSIIVPMKCTTNAAYQYEQQTDVDTHLFTGFLRRPAANKHTDNFLRVAIQLRIIPHYSHKGFIRESRFEGESILSDRLHVAIPSSLDPAGVVYRWGIETNQDLSAHTDTRVTQLGHGDFLFPFPGTAQDYLCCDGIKVRTVPW